MLIPEAAAGVKAVVSALQAAKAPGVQEANCRTLAVLAASAENKPRILSAGGAEARCAGLHDAEHALPSGACLAPGHAANPRPGAYVRYACEADVLAGGGDERRGRLAFVLCALGFVLALGALVGARCAPKRAPAARDAAAIELATSAVVVDDGPAPAGPVATAVELKAAPPLVVDA